MYAAGVTPPRKLLGLFEDFIGVWQIPGPAAVVFCAPIPGSDSVSEDELSSSSRSKVCIVRSLSSCVM